MDNMKDDELGLIARGEPILLKSEVNALYLGVKKFNKQNVILSTLENLSCEFVFILETKGGEDETISINDSFQIKSLLGGSLTLNPTTDGLKIEDLIYNTEDDKLEDEQQLVIEETLEKVYSQDSLMNSLEPVNNFVPVNYSLKFFSLDLLTEFEHTTAVKFGGLLQAIVDYHFFLQDWGCVSGKELRSDAKDGDDEYEQRLLEENLYYDYEEASETNDKLINKSNELLTVLRSMETELATKNYVSCFGWEARLISPDLALKVRQKALLDLSIFDYLVNSIKLILQKTYQSLDFDKIFGIRYDTDRRKEADSSIKRSKLKRLLFNEAPSWKKLRQTPQSVCRPILDKILSVSLEIIFLGVKNSPENVKAMAPHIDTIYYMYSFFKPVARDILFEISKFMVYPNEDHIVAWISKVEILGERRGNIEDQVNVLKILNNFCTDFGMNKDCLAIQKRIRIQLFNIGTNAMKRGNIFFHPETETRTLKLEESAAGDEVALDMLHNKSSPRFKGQDQNPVGSGSINNPNMLAIQSSKNEDLTKSGLKDSVIISTEKKHTLYLKDQNLSNLPPIAGEERNLRPMHTSATAAPLKNPSTKLHSIEQKKAEQWTKCIVKICKPANSSLSIYR